MLIHKYIKRANRDKLIEFCEYSKDPRMTIDLPIFIACVQTYNLIDTSTGKNQTSTPHYTLINNEWFAFSFRGMFKGSHPKEWELKDLKYRDAWKVINADYLSFVESQLEVYKLIKTLDYILTADVITEIINVYIWL